MNLLVMKSLQQNILRMLVLLCTCLLFVGVHAQNQKVLRVKVWSVTIDKKGKVVEKTEADGITVKDKRLQKELGKTNADGELEVTVPKFDTELVFIGPTYTDFDMKSQREVVRSLYKPKSEKVTRDQVKVEVELIVADETQGFKQATKKGLKITDVPSFDKTALDRGADGTIYYSVTWRCPKAEFKKNMRAVVQPFLVLPDTFYFGHPISVEAEEFYKTQNRQYAFDKENALFGDSLNIFMKRYGGTVHRLKDCKTDTVGDQLCYSLEVRDSIKLAPDANPRQYQWLFYEDYNRIFWGQKDLVSTGISDPLHWFDFACEGLELPEYFDVPQTLSVQSASDKANLHFEVGKSELALDSLNMAELEKIAAKMNRIRSNDGKLLGVTLKATSSPEGNYERNLKLSDDRLRSALNALQRIAGGGYERKQKSYVAGWDTVAVLMRRDSLLTEAAEVEAIVKENSFIGTQGALIARKPYYNIIKERYLPQLRRVDYELEFTESRILNYDEVKQKYEADTTHLMMTLPLYYTLYKNEPDEEQRFRQMQDAVKEYRDKRDARMAANDLTVELNKRGTPDASLLAGYIGTPEHKQHINEYKALVANYIIALVREARADSARIVAYHYLPYDDDTRMVHVVVGALNNQRYGYFDPNGKMRTPQQYDGASNQSEWHKVDFLNYISETGARNEVAFLLYCKKNEAALERCADLDSLDAVSYYLKAICNNRCGHKELAKAAYRKAVKMDPTLEAYSLGDADIYDLLPEEVKAKDGRKYGQEKIDPTKLPPAKVPQSIIKQFQREIQESHETSK